MRNFILLIALTAILVSSKVEAADFYQWTTEDGVVSVTDDARRIPARYRATAIERSFKDISAKHTTLLSTSLPSPNAVPVGNPNHLPDEKLDLLLPECDQAVAVTTERRQVGEYNRTFYIVTDECGNVVYDSPVPVRLQLNR